MARSIADMTQRQAAIVAGSGLLTMTAFWLFADWLIFQSLVVPGDATATVNNIVSSEVRFRTGIFGILVVLVCDVVVAWALYAFLAHVNKGLALLAAWLRLIYAAMLGVALPHLVRVLTLLSGADYLAVLETDRVHARAMLSIDSFMDVWAVGLIVFGLHLLVLGYLALKSARVPAFLGILLIAAGLSYEVDYAGQLLNPGFDTPVSTLLGWGELVFMFWLLWKGGRDAASASPQVAAD